MRSAMPPTGSPNGTPMTVLRSTRSALPRTRRSRALSISVRRRIHPRIVRVRRSMRSPSASPSTRLAVGGGAMFYDTSRNDHGLPRDPFKAIVSPRPVGWVTSMSAKGEINLAPYSFFNAVSDDPPIVMFSSDGYKDSLTFVAETKEFVCNLATFDLRAAVVETSASFPRGVDEMAQVGLAPAPCQLVRPPRVAA